MRTAKSFVRTSRTQCALCHQTKPLRRSHIVPEFLWKPLYDENHRTVKLDAADVSEQWQQKGTRENLLCGDCEQLLSARYETPFCDLWRSHVAPLKNAATVHLTGLDYQRTFLFLFSVLWRASVAGGDFWSHTSLGDRHNERLRVAILNDRLPNPGFYFVGGVLQAYKGDVIDLILTPRNLVQEGLRSHLLYFGGCAWIYSVSNHAAPHWSRSTCLQQNGSMTLDPIDVTKNDHFLSVMRPFLEQR